MERYADDDLNKARIESSMESAAIQLTDFSVHLFADLEVMDIRQMSALIPHSLYSATLVHLRIWRQTKSMFCKVRVDALKRILGHFRKRWLVAGAQISALPRHQTDIRA